MASCNTAFYTSLCLRKSSSIQTTAVVAPVLASFSACCCGHAAECLLSFFVVFPQTKYLDPTQPLLGFNLTATLSRLTAADTVGFPFKRISQHAGVQRESARPQHGATGIDAGLAGPRPSMCHLDLQHSSVIQISPPLSSLQAEVRLISEGCRHSLSTTYPVTLNRWKILWP